MHSFVRQAEPLHHAEAMLFVDHGQTKPAEFDIFFEQCVRAHRHVHQALRQQLLELRLFPIAERTGKQHGDVIQLPEQRLQIQEMLGSQYFGGREHGHLVSVLDGDHRRFCRHDGLAAAHVALQQTVHGARRGHVTRNLAQHAFLRAGGLEWQHLLDAFPHTIRKRESDARIQPRLGALQFEAALEPEKFFENQAELGWGTKCVKQTQIRFRRRKV